jgi:hypothetical protein
LHPRALSLTYDTVPTSALDAADRDDLWDVYRRHFDADRSALDASLARADQVIRFRRRGERALRGLVAMSLREAEHEGRRFLWLWAGALAIDRECRGQWLLERAGVETFARIRLRHPSRALLWIYESNSFQSFRMVARNYQVYWPHPGAATPTWEAGVIEKLARVHHGARWDTDARVLRPTGKKHVRPTSSQTRTDDDDPMRRFYRGLNPEASAGAAIVMLVPLDFTNLRALGRRAARSLLGRGV